jgi:hypothetical protein
MPFAVIALFLYLHCWGEAERHRYEARVEALRAAGQPVRYEDLETPPVPDAENGAKAFAEAARMLIQRKGTEPFSFLSPYELDPSVLEAMPAEEREGRRAYLRSLKPYFDLLAEASRRPRWRLEHDWKKGSLVSPSFDWLRDAPYYLRWSVALDPEDRGRAECAAEAALLAIGLGERCRIPFAIGDSATRIMTSLDPATLLRTACGSPSISRPPHPGFDAVTFRRLADRGLAKATPVKGPSRAAFAQERVWTLWAVEAFRAGEKTDFDEYLPLKGKLLKSRVYRPFLYRDANRALDLFEEAIALAETSPEEAMLVAERLKTKYATKDPNRFLTGGALWSLTRTFEWYAKCVAVQRLTRVVMALLEYRQKKGAWPETVDALGEMPLDPYSGQPFRYEHLEGCYARIRAAREIVNRKTGRRIDEWEEWESLESDNLAWTFKD